MFSSGFASEQAWAPASPQIALIQVRPLQASASRAVSLPHGTAIWLCLGPSKCRPGGLGAETSWCFFFGDATLRFLHQGVERANNWRSGQGKVRDSRGKGGKGWGGTSRGQLPSRWTLHLPPPCNCSRHPHHPNSPIGESSRCFESASSPR